MLLIRLPGTFPLRCDTKTCMPKTGEKFERAVEIMARLRGPGGCPWDREQTFDSIKPYTLEETYEVLEAIDNRDWDELTSELGDLLLQVLFYAEMGKEQGSFSIDDVLDRLSNKLVDRHPHVFGDATALTAGVPRATAFSTTMKLLPGSSNANAANGEIARRGKPVASQCAAIFDWLAVHEDRHDE